MAYVEANDYVKGLVAKARAAQEIVGEYTQAQIDAVVYEVAKCGYLTAYEMAVMAHEETGMGSVEGKLGKNEKTPQMQWWDVHDKKSVGVVEVDEENGFVCIAKPCGVVASIVPSTNPTVTPVGNGIQILKGRNAVIFCPHPKAKKSTYHMCELLREAVAKVGCPKDIIQCVEEPTLETSQMVMSACDAVVATGGPGMVRAAYSSGKPSFGVGQGNVQMILGDDYEDLDKFVEDSISCRTFDMGLGCTSDQMVHIPADKYEAVKDAFVRHGALYIDDQETIDALRNLLFDESGRLQRDAVGNTAVELADKLGLEHDGTIRTLLLPCDAVAEEDYFTKEILCPVERLHKYTSFEQAVEDARANYMMEGKGHVSALYTENQNYIALAGNRLPVCRLMICQTAGSGAGRYNNGFNGTNTLGCGFWGGNSIDENLSYKHLIQYTRISTVVPAKHEPTFEEIFPDLAAEKAAAAR